MAAQPTTPDLSAGLAQTLNESCRCMAVDLDRLRENIQAQAGAEGLASTLFREHPHLFSPTPVFLSKTAAEAMAQVVRAAERVSALAPWQAQALAHAPAIARLQPGNKGVFFGFDFHLTPQGPQLIEINTNAGGGFLNLHLLQLQGSCCEEVSPYLPCPRGVPAIEEIFAEMFRLEWSLAGRTGELGVMAVVDDNPAGQFLYPEFLAAQGLLQRHGLNTVVADAASLRFEQGRLWAGDTAIDLVYNRLTDFYLEEPRHGALKAACENDAVVLTPHPRAHALLAAKRNLTVLCDEAALLAMGARPEEFFFKPNAGYGSRAAYRGDKLTRRVFEELLAGGYVAQRLALPGERHTAAGSPMKMDFRCYAYAGETLLVAARLYQGQTTNMRTPMGGFAAVYTTP